MPDREVSDFSMSRVECPKCKAVWLNGSHVWAGTGKPGSELDLAGLVCNNYGDETCINPLKGKEGGDTWEARYGKLNEIEKIINDESQT
jgi:hypothetical protein